MNTDLLLDLASKAREYSYAPYSNFTVGAALLAKSGKIYTGSNIESASFGATLCAERAALANAVNSGERSFLAICIRGAKKGESDTAACMPCGICRQMLSEFCGDDFIFILKDKENTLTLKMEELFPYAFKEF